MTIRKEVPTALDTYSFLFSCTSFLTTSRSLSSWRLIRFWYCLILSRCCFSFWTTVKERESCIKLAIE